MLKSGTIDQAMHAWSWRLLRSGSRPVPGTRRIGNARSGSSRAMMNAVWKFQVSVGAQLAVLYMIQHLIPPPR
jgi:hypothetical protein